MKREIMTTRQSIGRAPLRLAFIGIPLLVACTVFLPTAQAQLSPAPDGGYQGLNTAEGQNALFSLDVTAGFNNTAVGYEALYNNVSGSRNTAVGMEALVNNRASDNTAIGFFALETNTSGTRNTAIGSDALNINNGGNDNTAIGTSALYNSSIGNRNTAIGSGA